MLEAALWISRVANTSFQQRSASPPTCPTCRLRVVLSWLTPRAQHGGRAWGHSRRWLRPSRRIQWRRHMPVSAASPVIARDNGARICGLARTVAALCRLASVARNAAAYLPATFGSGAHRASRVLSLRTIYHAGSATSRRMTHTANAAQRSQPNPNPSDGWEGAAPLYPPHRPRLGRGGS
jgi:hypothetical protein